MKAMFVAFAVLFVLAGVPAFGSPSAEGPAQPVDDWDRMAMEHGLPSDTPGDLPPGSADLPLPEGTRLWGGGVHNQCSKAGVRLVFKNPDLQENEQGIITASGGFFIQFQAVVPEDRQDLADKIKRLGFSFLKHSDEVQSSALSCNTDIQENMVGQGLGGGAYLLYYRSDFDPSDGFFVPLFTFLVADGDYGAAIHAYAENSPGACATYGNPQCVEVARGWAKAIVNNCDDANPQNQLSWSSNGGCAEKTTATCKTGPYSQARDGYSCQLDAIVPWPIILPGDGQQTNGVNGITVDFAELIQTPTLKISHNGRDIPSCDAEGASADDCWQEYTNARQWRDADLVPTNDQNLAGQECRSPGSNNNEGIAQVCARMKYGPGFSWEGAVNPGDVIRVEARDHKGNLVTKTAGFGHATSGGVVFLSDPELAMDAPQGDNVEIRPGDTHEFNVRVVNIGNGDAHASVNLNHTSKDPTFKAFWADNDGVATDHIIVPADGQEHYAKIVVQTTKDSEETFGSTPPYQLNATATYDAGGVPVTKAITLFVKVSHEASAEHAHLHDILEQEETMKEQEDAEKLNATKSKGDKGMLPGFGVAAAAGALGLLVAVETGRRRRRAE